MLLKEKRRFDKKTYRFWGLEVSKPIRLTCERRSEHAHNTLFRENVWLTFPPCRAIRETSTRTIAGSNPAVFQPAKAGQVKQGLGSAVSSPRYTEAMCGFISSNCLASFCCARYNSHRNCKFIQNPGVVPKYFANRSAVLGVIPLFPFISSLIR